MGETTRVWGPPISYLLSPIYMKGEHSVLTYTTLASGSSGNCGVVSCGSTHLLVDAGISAKRITTALKGLGIDPASLGGVLVTHEHSDHIAGLTTLTKQLALPVYATAPTLRQLCYRIPFLEGLCRAFDPGDGFAAGELWVGTFPTSHDAACSVGYTLTGDGCKAAVVTDLGYLTQTVIQAVQGCDLLVCETNHDEDWVRSGPYPYRLKQRILGDQGHLSNEAGAELAALAVESGARSVILAHLSAENNTPARARQAVARRLSAGGIDPERDLSLSVAPRKECGPVFRLERGRDTAAFRLQEGAALC